MVGKDTSESNCRIFHQCYLKCCQLQNLKPLPLLSPSASGKTLEFNVDRIRYQDWAPILNALSCDLSLQSVCIKSRQTLKKVLENIDCERLAKNVNKYPVIQTKFILNNLIEALVQLLHDTPLLITLQLEGLPLRNSYLKPLIEVLTVNRSLQHLHLPRCLIGDAGCMALCKVVRCLPNLLTLDLTGCDITPQGAGYIADLIKYQKLHRYSENWLHTLRYRLPDLDTMAGLRRITLCNNPGLGDEGVDKLLEVIADDLWIKAMDVQSCSLTEESATSALQVMNTNTTLVILDLRLNAEISRESIIELRERLRKNLRNKCSDEYPWLSCGSNLRRTIKKSIPAMTSLMRNSQSMHPYRYKEEQHREYIQVLEEQLRKEISHRQQLEELNQQLVEQMRQIKQQQMILWMQNHHSSGSERSIRTYAAYDSYKSGSSNASCVRMDYQTLCYIQQAFKDIYKFIKNNQCQGKCLDAVDEAAYRTIEGTQEDTDTSPRAISGLKKSHSAHLKLVKKTRKKVRSAHEIHANKKDVDTVLEQCKGMFEKQMGDNANNHNWKSESKSSSFLDGCFDKQIKTKKNSVVDSDTPSCSSSSIESCIETQRVTGICLNNFVQSSDDDYDDGEDLSRYKKTRRSNRFSLF